MTAAFGGDFELLVEAVGQSSLRDGKVTLDTSESDSSLPPSLSCWGAELVGFLLLSTP